MHAIRDLTAEAAASVATDAFQHASAIADRTRLTRCLFHLYDSSLISLHSGGNALLRRAVEATGRSGNLALGAGVAGSAIESADGGDLLELLELLRWAGDALWESIEHGDGNPLWEVAGTLLSALAAALFPRGARFDPSDDACVRVNQSVLVRATQIVSFVPHASTSGGAVTALPAPSVTLSARLWGAAGLHTNAGVHAPASWHHGGLHAAVLLVMGLWHFAVFRAEPAAIASELRDLAAADDATMQERGESGAVDFASTVANYVRSWPGCSSADAGPEDLMEQLQVRALRETLGE